MYKDNEPIIRLFFFPLELSQAPLKKVYVYASFIIGFPC